jgi:hypothetical protein
MRNVSIEKASDKIYFVCVRVGDVLTLYYKKGSDAYPMVLKLVYEAQDLVVRSSNTSCKYATVAYDWQRTASEYASYLIWMPRLHRPRRLDMVI